MNQKTPINETVKEELRAHAGFPTKFHPDHDLVIRLETAKRILAQTIERTEQRAREEMFREMREIAQTNRDAYSGEKEVINEHVLLFLKDYSTVINYSDKTNEHE